MAKIKVELRASYGCNCMGCGYGSKETVEIEVNEQELETLRKLGSEKISCKAVVEAIENGETVLQSLHEELEEKFYYMVEEYWLYEADNESLEESLFEAMENDLSEDIFTPSIDIEDNYDLEDEEDVQSVYNNYILNEYYDWVRGNDHDHEFIAERVGLDLDACRDDEIDYTIILD